MACGGPTPQPQCRVGRSREPPPFSSKDSLGLCFLISLWGCGHVGGICLGQPAVHLFIHSVGSNLLGRCYAPCRADRKHCRLLPVLREPAGRDRPGMKRIAFFQAGKNYPEVGAQASCGAEEGLHSLVWEARRAPWRRLPHSTWDSRPPAHAVR